MFVAVALLVAGWCIERATRAPAAGKAKRASAGATTDAVTSVPVVSVYSQTRRRPGVAPATTVTTTATSTPRQPGTDTRDNVSLERAQRHLLDTTFGAEARDASWSAWAQQTLRERIGGADNVESVVVSCRKTLCRVDVELADAAVFDRFVPALGHLVPWKMGAFLQPGADGKSVVVFLSREGRKLPRA